MTETPENRLKRMRMRAWHRGIKEMDLIFGRFADAHLRQLSIAELDAFDALLEENDQEIYAWITGQNPTPTLHNEILTKVTNSLKIR